jgi:hypothetical protein
MQSFSRSAFRLALLALSTSECDPGWGYRAVGGRAVQENGLRYDVAASSTLAVRVSASAVTGFLFTEVDLAGVGHDLPSDAHASLVAIDASGGALPVDPSLATTSECRPGGRPGSGFPAAQNVCFVRADFQIQPLVGCIRNPKLERIVLTAKVVGDGFSEEVRIPLTAM